jgi:hypothetical protein
MSVPFGSVHTIRVSITPRSATTRVMHSATVTLLFLVCILPADLSFQQHALWMVFGFHIETRFFLWLRERQLVTDVQANPGATVRMLRKSIWRVLIPCLH